MTLNSLICLLLLTSSRWIVEIFLRSLSGFAEATLDENRKFVHPIIVYSQISSNLSKPNYRLLKANFLEFITASVTKP